MFGLLLSLFFLPAFSSSVALDPHQPMEWKRAVANLKKGDSVEIEGNHFELNDELGSGSYGRVFETTYNSRAAAIKFQLDPKAVSSNPDHQVHEQPAQFAKFSEKEIPVPEIFFAPSKRPYLVMELVGRENLLQCIGQLPDLHDKLEGLEPFFDLLLLMDSGKMMPKDRKNLARNVVRSETGVYYLVDPGGVEVSANSVMGFPMEVALQILRSHEAAAVGLRFFEKMVRAGRYTHPFPEPLLKRPAVVQGRPDALWSLAYLLWGRENHHLTTGDLVQEFVNKYRVSHPALLAMKHASWDKVTVEERSLGTQWIESARVALDPKLPHYSSRHDGMPHARLFAFHGWQNDLSFAIKTFDQLRYSQKQEAFDTLSFFHRQDVISALTPLFCASEVAE